MVASVDLCYSMFVHGDHLVVPLGHLTSNKSVPDMTFNAFCGTLHYIRNYL